jgi:ornithine--oxo-acid transaminase
MIENDLTNDIKKGYSQYGGSYFNCASVVLEKAEGVYVFDVSGKKYLDFNTAYSALSHGHLHPSILEAACDQLKKMGVCSQAFYHTLLPKTLKLLCDLTGQDRAIMLSTGTEAVEVSLKIARYYGYRKKNIEKDKAIIIAFENNFHGRTLGSLSLSSYEPYKQGFGPFLEGILILPFSDIKKVEDALKNPNICAIITEPIQSEGGFNIPSQGFLKSLETLCKKNDVLFILDEIQTGLGRTGHFLASSHYDVKGDIVTLGKALGGGIMPVSSVLGRSDIFDLLPKGSHGSTFGGTPLACAVAYEALTLTQELEFSKRSQQLGAILAQELKEIKKRSDFVRAQKNHKPLIKDIRGLGLFVGLEIDNAEYSVSQLVEHLLHNGLLVKGTRKDVVRLIPPLIISEKELLEGISIIDKTIVQIDKNLA